MSVVYVYPKCPAGNSEGSYAASVLSYTRRALGGCSALGGEPVPPLHPNICSGEPWQAPVSGLASPEFGIYTATRDCRSASPRKGLPFWGRGFYYRPGSAAYASNLKKTRTRPSRALRARGVHAPTAGATVTPQRSSRRHAGRRDPRLRRSPAPRRASPSRHKKKPHLLNVLIESPRETLKRKALGRAARAADARGRRVRRA
jgi:hypothetical protein